MSFTSVAGEVRERVLASRDRFWRPDSFGDHSPDAVAQALSRLTRDGELRRVRRGLYWRGTPTRLGMAPPPPDRLAREVAGQSRGTGPAGRSAALALGLSTQVPRHETIAVPARAPQPGGLRLVGRGQCQAPQRAADPGRGRAAGSAARLGCPGRGSGAGSHQPDHRPRRFRRYSRRPAGSGRRYRAASCARGPQGPARGALACAGGRVSAPRSQPLFARPDGPGRVAVTRFRDSAEFAPTVDSAAARLGISPAAVEKDYWVSEARRDRVLLRRRRTASGRRMGA